MIPIDPDAGLLTPDEEELLRRVERSKVWRLIRDALCMEREQLFGGNSTISGLSGHPNRNEALWTSRGAILLIQHLLQEGPRLVIWYQRYMAEQAERKARDKGTVARPEREFSPRSDLDDKPDFDL